MTIDIAGLKRLAEAVKGTCDHQYNAEAWTKFRYAASPSAVLALIAEVERLRAEVAAYKSTEPLRGLLSTAPKRTPTLT
jgi:hypothetical protein